ncbi:MAG: aldo/keto reductase [Synergistaceae bacterium]|nr:aldo/keto reductase [Synergistaceae bacterium]
MMRIFFTAIAFMLAAAAVSYAQEVKYIDAPKFDGQIYLYGEPAKEDVDFEQWYEIQGRGQFVRNVKVPALIPYIPDPEKSNGAAIIIAPGGAFLHHTFGSGGYEAAEWFKSQGFATFILKYRVEITPREEADYQAYVAEKMAGYRAGGLSGNYAPATPDYAYEDMNAAVKLIRERAGEFHVKPDKIGIVGFSAGALMAVYNAESAPSESKADFIASIYGQLVMREMPDKLPPMFAAMSSDDELSGQSGFEIIQAWQKRGIVELHLYGQGGHNFGMGHKPFTNYLWPAEFLAWLRMIGVINQPASTAKITLNNGLEIPQFGIGTFMSTPEQAHDAVLTALRAGYRHIDTAHAYQNERGVGAAVKDSGIPRSEIWITSKLWPTDYSNGNAEASINKMLERLGTDYIDLLYLHQPVGDYMAGWRGLEAAVKAGKVRAIGLSNFDLNEKLFDNVIAKAEVKPAIVQIELHPYAQRKSFRKKCAENGIAIEGWYPLGGTHGGNSVLFADPVINEIAGRYGKTPAEIILRWHVQEGFSTIPGSRNEAHIRQNITVLDFELSEDDMNRIRALDGEKRFYTGTFESSQRFTEWTPED